MLEHRRVSHHTLWNSLNMNAQILYLLQIRVVTHFCEAASAHTQTAVSSVLLWHTAWPIRDIQLVVTMARQLLHNMVLNVKMIK